MDIQKLRILVVGEAQGLNKITDSTAKGEKSSRRFGGAASEALGVFTGTLMTKAVDAIADFVQQGVQGFGDLQQQVANISTIKPTIDTRGVFDALNMIQTRVPQTAAQLGDALYDVFSSVNVTQKEGLQLVEQFARGAVGAQTEAKTFGTSIMGVMNAYKLSVTDAAHTSDLFFNTVNAGVVSGQELASSLGPVTQASKAAGQSQEFLFAAIAAVTKEGGPAAQNINNLNNMLSKLTTTDAVDGLKSLGVEVTKNGKYRGFVDVLSDLKKKLDPLPEAVRMTKLNEIFPDAQARQGAQTLLSQLDFLKATLKDNIENSGATAQAYEKMSATFQSQSALVKNSISAIATALGAELLPLVTPFLSSIAKDLPSAVGQVKPALAALESGFKSTFAPLMPMVRDIAQFVTQQFGVVVRWFTENMPLIRRTVQTVLGAIAEFWKNHGETIKTLIGGALKIVLDVIKLAMQVITGDWRGAGETIKSILLGLWNWLKTWGGSLLSILGDIGKRMGTAALGIGKTIWEGIVNGVKAGAQYVRDAAANLAQSAVDGVKENLQIHSPSKKMQELGEFVTQGFALGIRSDVALVVAAVQYVAAATLAEMERQNKLIADAVATSRRELLVAKYGEDSAPIIKFDNAGMTGDSARAAAAQIAKNHAGTAAIWARNEYNKAVAATINNMVRGGVLDTGRIGVGGALSTLDTGGVTPTLPRRTPNLIPMAARTLEHAATNQQQMDAIFTPFLASAEDMAKQGGRRFLENLLGGQNRAVALQGLLGDIQKGAAALVVGTITDSVKPLMKSLIKEVGGDLSGVMRTVTQGVTKSLMTAISATYALIAASQRKSQFGIGSILGGIAGFALGGPAGALAGYNIGNAIDNKDYAGALIGGATGYLGGAFKGGAGFDFRYSKASTTRAVEVNVSVGDISNLGGLDYLNGQITDAVYSGLKIQAG